MKTTGNNCISSFAFFFKSIFNTLPPPPPSTPCNLDPDENTLLYYCSVLSKMVYVAPGARQIPPQLGQIVFESNESKEYVIPYFVMNSDTTDTIYLTCRGSYCFNDFMVDLNAKSIPFNGGYVHEGVFITAKNLYNDVKNRLINLSKENNNRKIILTGHSLGGGVAATVQEMFLLDFPNINISSLIFAPCACFTKNLWEMSLNRCRTYVLNGDFVPFLSFSNAFNLPKNSLPQIIQNKMVDVIEKKMNRFNYTPKHVNHLSDPFLEEPPPLNKILDNSIDFYVKPIPLYPPGDLFLICMDETKENKGAVTIEKIKDCSYFGQFPNNLNELRHMMSVYRDWIDIYIKSKDQSHMIK